MTCCSCCYVFTPVLSPCFLQNLQGYVSHLGWDTMVQCPRCGGLNRTKAYQLRNILYANGTLPLRRGR